MNIKLGYWLDSVTYPDALEEKEASIGEVVTGFKGLVGILETQLGLTSPKVSENLRIAEWQELIRVNDFGKMPFSKSFRTDSWNTAKEVLRRRDELVLAGWDPTVHAGGSVWFETLATLELLNRDGILGFPDRVRKLLVELQKQVQLGIDTITIIDEEELWDPWSVQLINLLKVQGVKIVKEPESNSGERNNQQETISDLSLLQKSIRNELPLVEARGDGSVLLVRSEQEWDAADFLISWLKENSSENIVIIKGEGSVFLDELLHGRGLPALGTEEASKWRAILQILPLTIDTYWKPLRVDRLMELLTIPSSPVPSKISYKLAKVLADTPGIGGPQWMKALDDGIQEYEELWSSQGLDEAQLKRKRKNLNEKLKLWVSHDFYDIHEGMALEKIIDICQKVKQWAMVNYQSTNELTYVHVIKIADEVVEGFKTLGVSSISRLQVGRILEEVIGEGSSLSNYLQEASKRQVVNHPGQIIGKADTVLWWGFHKSMSRSSIRTWTSKEKAWLMGKGVFLVNDELKRRREVASWQNGARFANKKLIMFAPTKVKGWETSIHPFWDDIRFAIAREENMVKKITFDASQLRKKSSFSINGVVFEREELISCILPAPLRVWEVPNNLIRPRKVESATSFEKLVSCPFSWTLRYIANIRSGNALSLPNESRMLGNLGHKILELLVKEKTYWEEDEVKQRTGELFDNWAPLMAAPLLEKQNGIKKADTRFKLQNSFKRFFNLMKTMGIKIQNTELTLNKTWSNDVAFQGTLDLIGETTTGRKVIIDAKYSNNSKRYKERLQDISVQLTLYHWLLSEEGTGELPVAYFMLKEGEFFTLPHEEIPTDYHIEGPSLLETNEVLKTSIEDVWSQIFKGTIIASGIETNDNSGESQELNELEFRQIIEPSCKYCEYSNLCGKRRVG